MEYILLMQRSLWMCYINHYIYIVFKILHVNANGKNVNSLKIFEINNYSSTIIQIIIIIHIISARHTQIDFHMLTYFLYTSFSG